MPKETLHFVKKIEILEFDSDHRLFELSVGNYLKKKLGRRGSVLERTYPHYATFIRQLGRSVSGCDSLSVSMSVGISLSPVDFQVILEDYYLLNENDVTGLNSLELYSRHSEGGKCLDTLSATMKKDIQNFKEVFR